MCPSTDHREEWNAEDARAFVDKVRANPSPRIRAAMKYTGWSVDEILEYEIPDLMELAREGRKRDHRAARSRARASSVRSRKTGPSPSENGSRDRGVTSPTQLVFLDALSRRVLTITQLAELAHASHVLSYKKNKAAAAGTPIVRALERKGWVSTTKIDGSTFVEITQDGRAARQKARMANLTVIGTNGAGNSRRR